MQIEKKANELKEYTVNLRRDFHKHPEIGFKEIRSSQIIADELKKYGYEVQTGIAKTGVVATLGNGSPVILLRFDMDALPVQEETGVEYASENKGLMHACGHDGHMAIGVTTAKLLHDLKDQWRGTVKFVFQPAEEGLGGCEQMIAAGILENPKPEIALGVHIWNEKPLGWIGIKDGPAMAGADIFTVKIIGAGGHGAIPQQSHDPIVAAANVVTAVQSIISRNISPLQSGVISFTQIQSGETFNVIPPTAILKGTIRYFDAEVHDLIIKRLKEIVQGVSSALGCHTKIDIKKLAPALVNNPLLSKKVVDVVKYLDQKLSIDTAFQTMGSEDMAYILEKIPGCYIFVGSSNQEKGLIFGHHSPKFNFDETALTIAISILTKSVIQLSS
jgi:amidohydrolase